MINGSQIIDVYKRQVFFSFSGGKDSLCVAQLIVNLANRGEIDMKQLTVQFIDEEAIFPCMEDMTKKWRRIFMMMGAKFEWYCVEVKHFNCFNKLSNDETFICWDSTKQDVWVRQPPSFAIRTVSYTHLFARVSLLGLDTPFSQLLTVCFITPNLLPNSD